MKIVRQLASALLLVVLSGLPAMACLTPDPEMTEAERDCCKRMGGQCGSMDMPSSHSCCQKEVSRPNLMLGTSSVQLIGPALNGPIVGELPQTPVAAPEFASIALHPPESPPGTTSILRI